MPDNDVDVQIKISKTGDGAPQAAKAIDQVKKAADSADVSTGNLSVKLYGFRNILHGLTGIARGGAAAIAGLGRALAGVVQVLANTAWGRIAMIASMVVTIGVAIYEKFFKAKDALDKTAESAENLKKKIPDDLGSPGLPNAADLAKKLTEEFDRSTAAAERTRKSMDELSDAELTLTLANIDKEVASGGMTAEQGKQARIEARLTHEQDKISREKTTVEAKVAGGEKAIADAEKSTRVLADSIAEIETKIKQLGVAPGVAVTPEEVAAARKEKDKGDPAQYANLLQANMLQKFLAELKKEFPAQLDAEYQVKAKQGPEIETGKARLATLDVQAKAAGVSASAQSIEVASEMLRKKDEEEARQAAERKAYNDAQAAAEEKHRAELEKDARNAAIARAEFVVQKESAEEDEAAIHLEVARKLAGAGGQSRKERAASAAALQGAQARWQKESGESVQAKALQDKIRSAVDPADIAKLMQALDSIGNAFRAVADKAAQVESQIKNGGMRTK